MSPSAKMINTVKNSIQSIMPLACESHSENTASLIANIYSNSLNDIAKLSVTSLKPVWSLRTREMGSLRTASFAWGIGLGCSVVVIEPIFITLLLIYS